jgi:hypothetical protein
MNALKLLPSARARPGGVPQPRTRSENANTMQHLILRPGPQLVIRAFRPEPDDTGSRLQEVDACGPALAVLALEAPTVQGMPAVEDLNFLPEMGRMNWRWP